MIYGFYPYMGGLINALLSSWSLMQLSGAYIWTNKLETRSPNLATSVTDSLYVYAVAFIHEFARSVTWINALETTKSC